MKIRTDMLYSDIMPIQVLTTPKRYDGRCKGNSCCLYSNNKNGKKGEKRKLRKEWVRRTFPRKEKTKAI